MSKLIRVGLFLSMFMLAFPVIAQSDDDELFPPLPLTQSIEVETEMGGIGTFYYPEGWYVYERESETTLAVTSLSNFPFPEDYGEIGVPELAVGQVIIDILIFTPRDLETIFEFTEIELEWTLEQFLRWFIEDTMEEQIVTSVVNHNRDIVLVPLPDYDGRYQNGIVAVVEIDNNNVGVSVIQALPDTLQNYTSTFLDILGTMQFISMSNVSAESTAEARNNTPSSGDFVDERGGTLTVDVPDGWTSTTTDDQLILANSAFTLQSVLEDGDAPQIGDVLVSIATFPPTFDDSLAEINFNTDVQDTLLSVFSGTQGIFPALQFGAPQTITLDNLEEAHLIDGTFARNGSQFEFTVIMVTLPSTRVVLVAYGDELRPFRDTLLEIAASSVYSP